MPTLILREPSKEANDDSKELIAGTKQPDDAGNKELIAVTRQPTDATKASGATQQTGAKSNHTGRSKGEVVADLRKKFAERRSLSDVEKLAFNAIERVHGDDDEYFTADDVLCAIKEFDGMRRDMRQLKYLFVGLTLFTVVFSAIMFGLIHVSIELTKDLRPEQDGVLKSTEGTTISTNAVTQSLQLSALANMSQQDLRSVSSIELTNDIEWSSHKVASVSKTSTGVTVQTQQGRIITVENDGDVFVATSDSNSGRRLGSRYFLRSTVSVISQTQVGDSNGLASAVPTVVLNEIMPDPPRGGSEFVELYNSGSTPVDLTGWTIRDAAGYKAKWQATVIPPKGFVVATFRTKLNNKGDTVYLRDASDMLVDKFTYTSSADDRSWARVPDGGEWSTSMRAPTRGVTNGVPKKVSMVGTGSAPCGGSCKGVCFATWNIQNLGQSKGGRPAVMDAIRSIIARYDVVAIQELSQMPKAPYVCGPNTEQVICDSRPNAKDYTVSASPRIGDEQYVIVSKNAAAEVSGLGSVYPDDDSLHSRPPYVFKLTIKKGSGNVDLVVGQTHTSPRQATQEILNFPDVLTWMEDEFGTSGNEHFVLAGDYNADGSYFKDHRTWSGSELNKAFGSYELLTPNHMDTTVAKSSNAYDRVIVDRDLANTAGTAAVLSLEDVDLTAVRVEGCAKGYVPSSLCKGDLDGKAWSDLSWSQRNLLAKELSDHHPVEICLNP